MEDARSRRESLPSAEFLDEKLVEHVQHVEQHDRALRHWKSAAKVAAAKSGAESGPPWVSLDLPDEDALRFDYDAGESFVSGCFFTSKSILSVIVPLTVFYS